MNDAIKGIILLAIVIYIVSPVDCFPGPIDDLIVLAIGVAGTKALASRNTDYNETTYYINEEDDESDDYTAY